MPWLLTLLLCLRAATAWAEETPPEPLPLSAELELEPDLKLAEPDPTEGFGVMTLAAEVAFVDQGAGQRNRDLNGGGGVSLQIVGGRLSWPVMVGLNIGILGFDTMRELRLGRAADVRHSTAARVGWEDEPILQLRHAEVVVRYQPWWGRRARPYAEVAAGAAGFWVGDNADQQRFASFLYTATLGIDWNFQRGKPGKRGRADLALTTSFKRLGTSRIDRQAFAVIDGENGRSYAHEWTRAGLGLWIPFVGVTLAVDSRH